MRRKIIIAISIIIVFGTFLYVEHPAVRSVKTILSLGGIIDSHRVVVGITDVRSVDHSRGNKESDIMLIEYSDFNCVICAVMQDKFNRIVQEEDVFLVSRHFYFDSGGDGFTKAVIAECVAKHVGEEAYFRFMQFLYENQYTDSNTVDSAEIEAVRVGVEAEELQSCVADDISIRNRIKKDSEEAQRLGARGTPYIVVVYKDKPLGISYANEYGRFLKRIRSLVEDA